MTGDRDHTFAFSPGHFTPPADMWDREENALTVNGCPRVVLFSGGLDSLAGIVELLESTTDPVWPISHRSANPSTIRTQESLIEALKRNYHGRINYRVLECHLHGVRAPEESQRTRAFLYCSMGFAMAVALRQSSLIVYENGVTALNLPKRTGMLNARASRTAHPKTLRLLQDLYSLVGERSFDIGSPFASKTKSDVFSLIRDRGRLIFLNSSVSCSKTYKPLAQATHCGGCSQCIDRRFAAHAADCDSTDDASAYAFDFINESVCDGEVRTGIVDYLRQARYFLHANVDNFQDRYASELADALDSNRDEVQQVEALHTLCQRHGGQVQQAAQKMFKPLNDYPEGSLKTLLLQSDFARPPVLPLALQIAVEAEEFIRRAYTTEKPRNENDLNEKIDGFLSSHKKRFKSEHPCLSFATAKTIPDHSNQALDLLIETKYIRGSTSPSKVTEGIAADLTKYPGESLKLFLVYDPDGQIADRTTFKNDFERKGNCIVHII
jgi:7-cyano-7-deazaguanine synthase in queuosine biosynthesis